jgi:transitional endoplasmic reticulum ATPase
MSDENSTVQLSQSKMSELKLFKGDTIFIKGKKRKETVVVALIDNGLDDSKIRMNKVIRKNLRVRLGDVVQIRAANDVPNLTKIHILPFQDTIEGITGDLTKTYLIPYLKDTFRPVKKNDLFIVRGNFKPIEFKIVATEPK